MIKLTKMGYLKSIKYKGICKDCKSEYEAEREDLISFPSSLNGREYGTIQCQVCKQIVYVSPE